MKKSTKFLAIGLCALTACSLVACGGGEDGKGAYDATVTASEWISAFSFDGITDFQAKVSSTTICKYDEEAGFDDNKVMYTKTLTFSEHSFDYYEEVSSLSRDYNPVNYRKMFNNNGICTEYYRNGDRIVDIGTVGFEGEIEYMTVDWVKEDISLSYWIEDYNSYKSECVSAYAMFAEYYSAFYYDSKSLSYKYDEEKSETVLNIDGVVFNSAEIKFKDKKVISVDITTTEEIDLSEWYSSGKGKRTDYMVASIIYDYGVFEITPPASFINEDDAYDN